MVKLIFPILCVILCGFFTITEAQFVDEFQEFEKQCLEDNVFHCLDGTCISDEQYCDGHKDCPDGSDEFHCFLGNMTKCDKGTERLCSDSELCMPYSIFCNGEAECFDGSDETNCDYQARPAAGANASCAGFKCGTGGVCISWLWVCDGHVDCADASDEYNKTMCYHLDTPKRRAIEMDPLNCEYHAPEYHSCFDRSYCVHESRMCDNMKDCRDGSDEGDFCTQWPGQCGRVACPTGAKCWRSRSGPKCVCSNPGRELHPDTNTCRDRDECRELHARCSQICTNKEDSFDCSCVDGYTARPGSPNLCFAHNDTEPHVFYSTKSEIRYLLPNSKREYSVLKNLDEPYSVGFDGQYVYWLEKQGGSRAVCRADMSKIPVKREVIASLGLGLTGSLAVDWLAGRVYWSDVQLGHVIACRVDGSLCTRLKVHESSHPHAIALDPDNGLMYWVDWHNNTRIMQATMDGSNVTTLLTNITSNPANLAVDPPSGRLYYGDGRSLHGLKIDGNNSQDFVLLNSSFHKPRFVSVFENTVYFSDMLYNTIQTIDKVRSDTLRQSLLRGLNQTVNSVFMYHPSMQRPRVHPCSHSNCSDICILSAASYSCHCAMGRHLHKDKHNCFSHDYDPVPEYILAGSGNTLAAVRYDATGGSHPTPVNISSVRAIGTMAFDNNLRNLFIYDIIRHKISYIPFSEYLQGRGDTSVLVETEVEDVQDMDFDYIARNLYFLDSGRKRIEAMSAVTHQRVLIHQFSEDEFPISMCVAMDYGRLLVAVGLHVHGVRQVRIDAMGLDGLDRAPLLDTLFKGPIIKLRYLRHKDVVVMSDEDTGKIDMFHPYGTGRETLVRTYTSISQLCVTSALVLWADRHKRTLYWTYVDDARGAVRDLDMDAFEEHDQLVLQATAGVLSHNDPLLLNPCYQDPPPCDHVCVQVKHPTPIEAPPDFYTGYRCLCSPPLVSVGAACEPAQVCTPGQVYCPVDNTCVAGARCDNVTNCRHNEDEENCQEETAECKAHQKMCDGFCISEKNYCNTTDVLPRGMRCRQDEWECQDSKYCIDRSEVCDGHKDCPDGSDESRAACRNLHCNDNEFMCGTGSCVWKGWQCDGSSDCPDNSDEIGCARKSCPLGEFLCNNGDCVPSSGRCDGRADCLDFSDEDGCPDGLDDADYDLELLTNCAENEFHCERNTTICLPLSSRCNNRAECPGGTDEMGCRFLCPRPMFQCRTENYCIRPNHVCDGDKDCLDGSDEDPTACASTNATSPKPPALAPRPPPACLDMFTCRNTQCVEWRQVCDGKMHCNDKSDEGPLCNWACSNNTCEFSCQPTPSGPHCRCPPGWTLTNNTDKCADIDECAELPCEHSCRNVPGSFLCECRAGYALRADRRACKRTGSVLALLAVGGAGLKAAEVTLRVRSAEPAHYYSERRGPITDMQYSFNDKILYTATATGITESRAGTPENYLDNAGTPTMLTLDWVSGNLYFTDTSSHLHVVKVCNFARQKCVKIITLPSQDMAITAMAVDPVNKYLFFCVTSTTKWKSTIVKADFDGTSATDILSLTNCSALAADTYSRKLLVASPQIIEHYDYDGGNGITIHNDYEMSPPTHRITIIENMYYFYVPSRGQLIRCVLEYGGRCVISPTAGLTSENYAIVHKGVQRDDVQDVCAAAVCGGVCVPVRGAGAGGKEDAGAGTRCLCAGAKEGGQCVEPYTQEEQFTPQRSLEPTAVGRTLETLVIVAAGVLILAVVYVAYRRATKAQPEHRVVFRSLMDPSPETEEEGAGAAEGEGEGAEREARVLLAPYQPTTTGGSSEDAANPMQYLRQLWRPFWARVTPHRVPETRGSVDSTRSQAPLTEAVSSRIEFAGAAGSHEEESHL